jgi:hypothetical protein
MPASPDTYPIGQPSVLVRNLAVPWTIAFSPGGDALVTERDSARLLRVTRRAKSAQLTSRPVCSS